MKEKCKNCVRPNKTCIPYLMTLTTKEMLEWCRMWKDKLGWSNGTLAEKSNVPKGTIDRILAKSASDSSEVKLITIRPIICAIIGCTIEELESCEGLHDMNTTALIERNKYLEADVERLKKEATNQRTFLANQIAIKDRYIAIFGSLLAVAILIILGALIVDKFNPYIGFIWRN